MQNTDAALAFTEPTRVERVGTSLAENLSELRPSVVGCWDSSEDVVLAHVVARELGVGVRPAVEVEGIVSLLRPVGEGARVVLVAESFEPRSLAALAGVMRHDGGTVVGVGAVTGPVDTTGTEAADAAVVVAEPR
ncbi:MAG: hypothetical protein ACRDMV_22695 [Streptosporangiales bacterium]